MSRLHSSYLLIKIQSFNEERVVFVRERGNQYYSPFPYFTSKLAFDILLLRVLPPIILGTISYPLIGLRTETYAYFFKFLSTLILFNVTSAALCFCISLLFSSVALANLVAVLIILFEMLFGGLLLNKENLTGLAYWLSDFSFFNNAMEALVVNEVNGLMLVEHKLGLQVDVSLYLLIIVCSCCS